MSEFRFLTSSDEHLADLAPGFRKDNYRDAILSKLEWQGTQAAKFGANAVVRAGDFFHVKAANKTTMRTMALAARIHRKYSCPTYAVAGNHDMSNNDPDSLVHQPLGVMLHSGVFNRLTEEVFESGSMKVRLVGVDYTTDIAVDGLHDMVRKKDETYTIAFVHALAAMAPEERIQSFFGEKIFDYRDLVFQGCPDVYVFGHYHKDQGVVDHMGVKFVNLGAISRGALTFENMERRPKVSMIKCNSQGVFVDVSEVPCEDASQIFDLALKKRLDDERKNLDDFIFKLMANRALAADSNMDSRKQELDKYPDDLKKLALETLESAEAGTLEE